MKPKEIKEKIIISTLFQIQPCQPLPRYIAAPPTLRSQPGHQLPSYPVDNVLISGLGLILQRDTHARNKEDGLQLWQMYTPWIGLH